MRPEVTNCEAVIGPLTTLALECWPSCAGTSSWELHLQVAKAPENPRVELRETIHAMRLQSSALGIEASGPTVVTNASGPA